MISVKKVFIDMHDWVKLKYVSIVTTYVLTFFALKKLAALKILNKVFLYY